MENGVEDINKSYAVYSINNFKVGISDDIEKDFYTFSVSRDPIEDISFSKKEVDVKGSTRAFPEVCQALVAYKDGTKITGDVLSFTKRLLERYVMLFVIEKQIETRNICVKLECYRDCREDGVGLVSVDDSIHMHDEIARVFRSYGSECFNKIFEDDLLDDTDESMAINFDILKSVFGVANVESRYLLQYEFLKHLVAELNGKPHGSQAQVQQFVLNKYNPAASSMSKVDIRKSLLDPNKDQDGLTYYRNVIGHPAVTESEKEIFKDIDLYQTLIEYSRRINEVVLFAIREKKISGG